MILPITAQQLIFSNIRGTKMYLTNFQKTMALKHFKVGPISNVDS